MAGTTTNIAEAICEATKIISESVVKGVAYDKTLTCTITNADNKDKGEYTVTDGSSTFTAYSENTGYTVNTVVYVTVPNGDFKQLKLILGKKSDYENSEPFVYLSPFDTFVDFTDNLVLKENEDSLSLIANYPKKLSLIIYQSGGIYGQVSEDSLLNYDSTFTRLGIKAGFKSFVNTAIYGEYGLKITIWDKIDLTTAEKVNDWDAREHIYYLTSSADMYGNPYNFESFYTLAKVFDITNLGIITGIKVEFYQEAGTFKDKDDVELPYQYEGVLYPANLFTQEVYIGLGYDLNSFDDDFASLYTFNTSTYIKLKSDEENKKTVNLRWIHIDDNGTPIDVYKDDSSLGDYDIRWYRYRLGAPSADEYSGVYWEKTNLEKVITETELLETLDEIQSYQLLFHYEGNEIGNSVTNEYTYYENFKPGYDDGNNGEVFPTATVGNSLDGYNLNTSALMYWSLKCLDYYGFSTDFAKTAFVGYTTNNIQVSEYQGWGGLFEEGFVYHTNKYSIEDYYNSKTVTGVGCLHRVGFWELFTLAYKFYWLYPDKFDRLGVSSVWKTGGDVNPDAWKIYRGKDLYSEIFFNKLALSTESGTNFSLLATTSNETTALRKLFTYFTLSFGEWDYVTDDYGLSDYRPKDVNVYNELYEAVSKFYSKIDNPVYTVIIRPDLFSCELVPDKTLAEEKLKVIILYGDKKYYTNIITFTNEEEVVNLATKDNLQALTIKCLDDTYGNYRIYGDGNSLLDSSLSKIERTFEAHFDLEDYSDEDKDTILTEAESIRWEISAKYSMINIGINDEDLPQTTTDSLGRKTSIYLEDDKYIIEKEPDENGLIDALIQYYINSYFSQAKSENWVTCSIVKDSIAYTTKKELTFGLAGTTGTDCTLILDIDNNESAITVGKKDSIVVSARLYDADNNEQDINNNTSLEINWSWYKTSFSDVANAHLSLSTYIKDNVTYRNKCEVKDKGSLTINELYIIQCTLKGWGDYDLIAYLPIPIRATANYRYITGATTLLYDSSGNISWYKLPYGIYYSAIGSNANGSWVTPVLNSWGRIVTSEAKSSEYVYIPELKEVDYTDEDTNESIFSGYRLAPLDLYMDDVPIFGVLYIDTNSVVQWTQPILMIQNKYPSSMINEWNGKDLVIDEENGAIMSTMVSAGYKDSSNRFYGVMMGKWRDNSSDSEMTNTGVYGFNAGQMSFAFKDDGTAFIGKSKTGRIEFDGNYGTIQSASYSLNKTGMKIDLNSGYIDIKGTLYDDDTNTSTVDSDLKSHVKLSATDPYFLIESIAGNELLYIGSKRYILQSDGFLACSNAYDDDDDMSATGNGTGIRFDLLNGRLLGYSFQIRAFKKNSSSDYIEINSKAKTYPLNVNNKFKVKWDGTMEATAGYISGNLEIDGKLYVDDLYSDTIGTSYLNVYMYTSSKGFTYKDAISGETKTFNFKSSTNGGIKFLNNDTEVAKMGIVFGTDGAGSTTNNVGIDVSGSSMSLILKSGSNIAIRPTTHTFIEGSYAMLWATTVQVGSPTSTTGYSNNTNTQFNIYSPTTHIESSKLEYAKSDGLVSVSASQGSVSVTAGTITFNTTSPENQVGIYARFA